MLLALVVSLLASAAADVPLHGQYGILKDKLEYVFQVPPTKVEGVLFLAHGCSHSATDWWPTSDSCPKCIGLPVERAVVREALNRSYLVVALSSSDRSSKCWSKRDLPFAGQVIDHLYSTVLDSQWTIPLHLFGASSGGGFVGLFGKRGSLTRPVVASVCIQIMGLRSYSNMPPSLFMLMSKVC